MSLNLGGNQSTGSTRAWPERQVSAGEAARIMTGAKIPDGADAVVRLEDTHGDGLQVLIFNSGQT